MARPPRPARPCNENERLARARLLSPALAWLLAGRAGAELRSGVIGWRWCDYDQAWPGQHKVTRARPGVAEWPVT